MKTLLGLLIVNLIIESKVDQSKIDEVILTGGCSNLKLFESSLLGYLAPCPLKHAEDWEKTVVTGAAILARQFAQQDYLPLVSIAPTFSRSVLVNGIVVLRPDFQLCQTSTISIDPETSKVFLKESSAIGDEIFRINVIRINCAGDTGACEISIFSDINGITKATATSEGKEKPEVVQIYEYDPSDYHKIEVMDNRPAGLSASENA